MISTKPSARYALLLLPLLLVYANRHVAYWADLDEFQRWSEHTRKRDPRPPPHAPEFARLYLESDCNYPPLGALVSAGGMSLSAFVLERLGREDLDPRQVFRAALALVEGLMLVLMCWMLAWLGAPLPWLTGLGIYLLPSSWAGGATWGQIDPVTVAVLLFAAYAGCRVLDDEAVPRFRRAVAWLVAGACALTAALQIKQLALFALPGLLALLAIGIVALAYRHGRRHALAAAVTALGSAAAVFYACDRLLFEPPSGYASITSYVWTAGIWHTRFLTAHGPSIWTLLPQPGLSSADVPFYAGLSPKQVGYTLFALLFATLSVAFGRYALRVLGSRQRFGAECRSLVAHVLCCVGLSYWTMGVVLVGTHERHMAATFPFLLLGLFGLRQHAGGAALARWVGVTVLAAIVYGSFVYSVIDSAAYQLMFILKNQAFAATFLLTAFGYLYASYVWHLGTLR